MMLKWLRPPQYSNEYEDFAARTLHYTLLIVIGVVLLFPLFATAGIQLIFLPITLLLFLGVYRLLHTGRFRLSGALFLGGLWLVITAASFSINGLRNASFSTYTLIIIYTAIFFSRRSVILITLLSIVSGIVLLVGEMAGILPLRTAPLFLADRFFQSAILFAASGVLLSAASHVVRTSISGMRQHEQALMQRNQQLELEIQERLRAEARLRASEDRYSILFEHTSVPAAIYDQDGKILRLNDAAAKIFGRTPEELEGRATVHDLFSEADARDVLAIQDRVIANQHAEMIEGHVTLPNGREIYFLRHVIPLPQNPGEASSRVLVLTTDVTERFLAEQRKHELQVANEKNAFFSDFFSTISHDIKTPLTVMITSLYLLERSQDPNYQRKKLTQLQQQVHLLENYIQDMLMISRLEYLPAFTPEACDLKLLLNAVFERLRPTADQKRIMCRLILEEPLPQIMADEDQLRRAFVNLIENALNYTPEGGEVRVTARLDHDHVVTEIADTGIGIAGEDLSRIFERFYRTRKARETLSTGTGLGLAIVKRIVDMHHGTITVESTLGTGTTFRLHLPLVVS